MCIVLHGKFRTPEVIAAAAKAAMSCQGYRWFQNSITRGHLAKPCALTSHTLEAVILGNKNAI